MIKFSGLLLLSTLLSSILSAHPSSFSYEQHLEQSNLLIAQEKYDAALSHLISAHHYKPHNARILFNLGLIYCNLGRFDESVHAYREALSQDNQLMAALYNMGYALKCAGHCAEAAIIFRLVIAQDPLNHNAHLGLAFSLLMMGNFAEGWREHEWNLKFQHKDSPAFSTFLAENTLAKKRILLIPEGGLGDTIQFIRYAQCLEQAGAYVIAVVQKPLYKIMQSMDSISVLLASGDPVPEHDARVTLMSLPALYKDDETTMPRSIPYLHASAPLIQSWKNKITGSSYKVGICWQASIHNDSSRLPVARRGIPLEEFSSLATLPGVSFYSLQKLEGLEQLSNASFPLITFDHFDEEEGPFMDTAAIMMNMDLIITVDTAIAHLAGALGKKVWLLLPYVTDWRWLIGRIDSPWYPSMTIFKQEYPFDWPSAIHKVHNALLKEIEHEA